MPRIIGYVGPVGNDSGPAADNFPSSIEGTVVLGATINGDGRVTDVKVLDSVPALDKTAIEAVKQWIYSPVWINGQAAVFTFTLTIRFSLK